MAVADFRGAGPTACGGQELRRFFTGGLAALERCAAAIDALNVFPVPDADTGTNMLITVRHAVQGARDCDRAEAAVVARAIANAALHGARGNSGAIFAQLCGGFATSLDGAVEIEPHTWAAAWEAGASAAWQSVASPVEGTLLTVAHSTARAAVEAARTGADLCSMWQSMADAADATVADTPRLLPILERAHVVDAGALGLALFLRGCLHAFTGAPLPDPSRLARPTAATRHVIEEAGFSRYCTQFTLRGVSRSRAQLQADFAGCGESLDVVALTGGNGDAAESVHVHLHTDRPDDALAAAGAFGVVEDVRVDDMEQQRARYAAELEAADDIVLVPIVSGAGVRRLFESLLGVAVVLDGDHRQQAPEDISATLLRLSSCKPVIVLPNDASLGELATAAAARCARPVVVVPTRNMPECVAATLAFNPVESLERNLAAMTAAARAVGTVEIRYRSVGGTVHADATTGRHAVATFAVEIECGEDLAAAGEAGAIACAAGCAASVALITVYYGAGVAQAQAEALVSRLRPHFPAAEIEVIDGGQPDCPIWIAFDRHADANRH
jgi:DAK2 domain fusion protein YloV